MSFTPLSRNRFRCNTTGKVLKKAAVEGHQNNLLNRDHKPPPPLEPVRPARKKQELDYFNKYLLCPDCRQLYYARSGAEIDCACGTRIKVVNWGSSIRDGGWI